MLANQAQKGARAALHCQLLTQPRTSLPSHGGSDRVENRLHRCCLLRTRRDQMGKGLRERVFPAQRVHTAESAHVQEQTNWPST